jgi:hypothetical protein
MQTSQNQQKDGLLFSLARFIGKVSVMKLQQYFLR